MITTTRPSVKAGPGGARGRLIGRDRARRPPERAPTRELSAGSPARLCPDKRLLRPTPRGHLLSERGAEGAARSGARPRGAVRSGRHVAAAARRRWPSTARRLARSLRAQATRSWGRGCGPNGSFLPTVSRSSYSPSVSVDRIKSQWVGSRSDRARAGTPPKPRSAPHPAPHSAPHLFGPQRSRRVDFAGGHGTSREAGPSGTPTQPTRTLESPRRRAPRAERSSGPSGAVMIRLSRSRARQESR